MSTLLENVFDADALIKSYEEIRPPIAFKDPVQSYGRNLFREIHKARSAYLNKEIVFRKGRKFTITERGKVRHIIATDFRDRVPIHALCSNILIPKLKPYLIYDNCASLKDRGIDQQRERLRVHMMKYFHEHKSNSGYILKGDIKKYFDSIPHEQVIEYIDKVVKDEGVKQYISLLLKQFEKDGIRKSVGIGNEISQIIGVYYLTPVDNYIKNVCACKYYGRYMDDFYILHHDKEFLSKIKSEINKITNSLGLELHPNKTYIAPLKDTFIFLKVKFNLSETGKVTMRLHKDLFTRERRKLKKFARMVKDGELKFSDVKMQYMSWRGTVARKRRGPHGEKLKSNVYSNKKALEAMDKLFKELFYQKEEYANGQNRNHQQ